MTKFNELSDNETKSINGGFWPIVGTALAVAFWVWDNHDEIYKGMKEGVK